MIYCRFLFIPQLESYLFFRFTGSLFTGTVSAIFAVVADDILRDLSEGVNAVTQHMADTDLRAVGRIAVIVMLDFMTRQCIDILTGLKMRQTERRKCGNHQYQNGNNKQTFVAFNEFHRNPLFLFVIYEEDAAHPRRTAA